MIQMHSPMRVLTILVGLTAILSSAVAASGALFIASCGLLHGAARVIDVAASPAMAGASGIVLLVVLPSLSLRHRGQVNRYLALLMNASMVRSRAS